MHNEKFIAPFIAFIKEHLNFEEHFFVLVGGVSETMAKISVESNVLYLDNSYENKCNYLKLSKILKQYTEKADKVILHSLFSNSKLLYLFLNQHLLYKCYWVMWGADLYAYNKPRPRIRDKIKHYIRTKVYSKLGHFITYIKGDYELAQKWYGASGEYHKCFTYPSNLYKEYDTKLRTHLTTNIQLGNSADPTNNHIDVLEQLLKYKDENIKIFTPLSYGNQEYAKEVTAKGKELFGDKFIVLNDFMPFEKYLEFLSEIDIAIFAHKRQQAMGNTITLLGLGKKVYVDSESVQFNFFKKNTVEIFDVRNIELNILNKTIAKHNKERIKYLFSKEELFNGLKRIFND